MSKEKRAHPRIEGEISANILINSDENGVARVLDVSAGGIGFLFTGAISLGDHVIAHMDGGTRLEGDVVRLFEGGFAITLSMSEHKRRRLAEALDRERARGRALQKLTLERRIAKRVSGMSQSVVCETADRRFPVRIVDMSLTGVAIESDEQIDIDTLVVIGKMRGTIVRREGNRYGVHLLSAEDSIDAVEALTLGGVRQSA